VKDQNQLDEKLNSEGMRAISEMVKGLPDDVPSMSWRSQLNERILAEAKPKKAFDLHRWLLRPAIGLGLAAALALVVVFRPIAPDTTGSSVESLMIATHQDDVNYASVTGAGLSVDEMTEFSNPTPVADPLLDLDVF
jgi:hypothetical protein